MFKPGDYITVMGIEYTILRIRFPNRFLSVSVYIVKDKSGREMMLAKDIVDRHGKLKRRNVKKHPLTSIFK